jgi:Ca2+-dependent lipid-binding protein
MYCSYYWSICGLCINDVAINMCLRSQVRVSVKFLKGWPVVGRVRLCFASKPKVTMSYRPMDRNGIDVSLIPVLANMVVSFWVV